MDGPKHMYSNFVVQYNALFCIKNRGTRRRRRKGQEHAFSGLTNIDFYNRTQLLGLRQGGVGFEVIIHSSASLRELFRNNLENQQTKLKSVT